MKKGEVKVVGIGTYEKDGKRFYTLHGITPFEDYESEAGSVGLKAISEWTNRVDLSCLKEGDIVTLSYAKGFKGAAVLNNVTVIAPAK